MVPLTPFWKKVCEGDGQGSATNKENEGPNGKTERFTNNRFYINNTSNNFLLPIINLTQYPRVLQGIMLFLLTLKLVQIINHLVACPNYLTFLSDAVAL